MKEELVSFETAKLASEKGCFESSNNKWFEDEKQWLQVPTQSLLQRWLRKKGVDVEVRRCSELYKKLHEEVRCKKCLKYYGVIILESGEYFTIGDSGFTSDSYEEILKTGLPEALKLIN